jgi:hypothetical protein
MPLAFSLLEYNHPNNEDVMRQLNWPLRSSQWLSFFNARMCRWFAGVAWRELVDTYVSILFSQSLCWYGLLYIVCSMSSVNKLIWLHAPGGVLQRQFIWFASFEHCWLLWFWLFAFGRCNCISISTRSKLEILCMLMKLLLINSSVEAIQFICRSN